MFIILLVLGVAVSMSLAGCENIQAAHLAEALQYRLKVLS